MTETEETQVDMSLVPVKPGDVSRAKRMVVAQETKLRHESLYKSLSRQGQPGVRATVLKDMIRVFVSLVLLASTVALVACASDDEAVIRIGAAVSETGRYAEEGEHTRRGYLTWEAWVNGEYGGITVGDDRYSVELVMYDDQSDPSVTAELVERLIAEDKVDFMLGPYSSTLTQSAIEVAEANDTILIEGTGASETLFQQSYRNLFAVLTPAGSYTQSALEALADMGARSIVIAYADVIFPSSVAEGARRWAAEYGLDVLQVEKYPQDISDVSGLLSEFNALNPDVFIGAGYFNDAVLFATTAKEIDFNPKAMVLTVGPTNPELIERLGEDANYLIGPTQWEASMSYRGEYFGSASDYAERYGDMWGGSPSYQSASATAAALALHLAIESAGSLDADEVRAALRSLNVDTFYGSISFDSTGKNTSKPMGAVQIQGGGTHVVAPANAAVADLIYPAPNWKNR